MARSMEDQLSWTVLTSLNWDDEEFRESIRWKKISMVFQGAMNALNPVHRVGDQIVEAILAHEDVPRMSRRWNGLKDSLIW